MDTIVCLFFHVQISSDDHYLEVPGDSLFTYIFISIFKVFESKKEIYSQECQREMKD